MDYSDPKTVLKYVKSMSISYPVVLGDRKIAAQIGPLSMLPTTYVFDPAGNPAVYKVGLVTRESLEEFMRESSAPKPESTERGQGIKRKGREGEGGK